MKKKIDLSTYCVAGTEGEVEMSYSLEREGSKQTTEIPLHKSVMGEDRVLRGSREGPLNYSDRAADARSV